MATFKSEDFEKKLAVKRAKADIRKAEKKWYNTGASIDDVLHMLGYNKPGFGSGYKFNTMLYTGIHKFMITIDTYDLIIGNGKLKATVEQVK